MNKIFGQRKVSRHLPHFQDYIDKYIDSIEATPNHTKSRYNWTGFCGPSSLCLWSICQHYTWILAIYIYYRFLQNVLQQVYPNKIISRMGDTSTLSFPIHWFEPLKYQTEIITPASLSTIAAYTPTFLPQ